jgi:uncharacterized protein YjaZ
MGRRNTLKIVWSIVIILMTASISKVAGQQLEIIDLSQLQIRLINDYKNAPPAARVLIEKKIRDSVYKPYKYFWDGYINGEENIVKWMTKDAQIFINYLNERNNTLQGMKFGETFMGINDKMKELTGYSITGKWHIVYCMGQTNLGGIGPNKMVIDLSHSDNKSIEAIAQWLPHEFAHNIMDNINPFRDSSAIGYIIGEGFATYVNELYWGDKLTTVQNLGYTEQELANCKKERKLIWEYFQENKFSTQDSVIQMFRSRREKLKPELPGAIGYYIGYNIIKMYAAKSSWKDVFHKKPRVIYELATH